MKNVDVTVGITGHHEGILIHKTLRSIADGIKYATKKGVVIECIISLDNPDTETLDAVNNFVSSHKDVRASVFTHAFGDISKNRNFLIDKSTGTYLSFFDGDDFFTENYLYEAFTFAESRSEPAVYSPRYLMVFEGDNYLVEKPDCSTQGQLIKNLFETNYFIGQSFVHRDILTKVRFADNTTGYGFEDWHFACQVAAEGFKFYNVPGTIFFYRRKKNGSLLASHVGSSSVIRPSKLFRPDVYARLDDETKIDGSLSKADGIFDLGPKKYVSKKLQNYELINHYVTVQLSLHKNIANALKRRHSLPVINRTGKILEVGDIPERFMRIGFTKDLMRQWAQLNGYEPLIRMSDDVLRNLPVVEYPMESPVSDAYYRLCKQYSEEEISDIVLVPHLTKGGADLAAINLIKTLSKNDSTKKILVVTTIKADSPWLDEVGKLDNVIFIEGKQLLEQIDDDRMVLLLLRIIQHWGVARLTIINSEIGYKLVTRHTGAIKDAGCKSFLHTYAYNMTDDGYLYNVISNGLVDAYKGVDTYVTDSSSYKNQLVTINGFDASKVTEIYSQVELKDAPKKVDYTKKRKILWASRVCDDKLVDVLVGVGKQLDTLDIGLDIYGSIEKKYTDGKLFERMIADTKNIEYMGSYDGFASLPVNDYDMFLLTSKNEGMPFVVLEACAAGIFVVAPDVGGIPETIRDGTNGNLLSDKFNPSAYVDAVMRAYESSSYADGEAISKYNKTIMKRHSASSYEKSVRKIMNI